MIQRAYFLAFCVAALFATACGRQVTPNPPGTGPGGLLPGYTSIKFDVAAPFNFSSYQYTIVFNTTGSGITPETNTQQTNWAGYSYAIVAAGNGGSTNAYPIEYLRQANIAPAPLHIGTTPQQFQYNPNSNGTGTEFSVVFQRLVFTQGLQPSPSPSASPSSKPTVVGAASTPTPTPVKVNWLFNAFTSQANAANQFLFVDSMGTFGPTDSTFVSPNLDMDTCFDIVVPAQSVSLQIDPPAQIESVEIANNPGNCSGTSSDLKKAGVSSGKTL
jgi:hypothetical protein